VQNWPKKKKKPLPKRKRGESDSCHSFKEGNALVTRWKRKKVVQAFCEGKGGRKAASGSRQLGADCRAFGGAGEITKKIALINA